MKKYLLPIVYFIFSPVWFEEEFGYYVHNEDLRRWFRFHPLSLYIIIGPGGVMRSGMVSKRVPYSARGWQNYYQY